MAPRFQPNSISTDELGGDCGRVSSKASTTLVGISEKGFVVVVVLNIINIINMN